MSDLKCSTRPHRHRATSPHDYGVGACVVAQVLIRTYYIFLYSKRIYIYSPMWTLWAFHPLVNPRLIIWEADNSDDDDADDYIEDERKLDARITKLPSRTKTLDSRSMDFNEETKLTWNFAVRRIFVGKRLRKRGSGQNKLCDLVKNVMYAVMTGRPHDKFL